MATGEVGVTTVTTPSDREIVITRVVHAPREPVFEAYTDPRHVPHWMGPRVWTMWLCEIDLRPGGGWRFAWHGPDGAELEMHGVYQELAPPERLVFTESWSGDWPETLTRLTLTEKDGKTTITTSVLYPSQDARDAALKTGMTEGMSEGFDRLSDYLRSMA